MALCASAVLRGATDCRPETWFHIIGGNASKEGLAADIAAIADAGIGGIQFFHGGSQDDKPWPGVTEMIPCLSEKWLELVKFAEGECRRHGLSFKVQNCPGWSMSGGPWIPPQRAMRKLVAFEPGKRPSFDADDDYREIGEVSFPLEQSEDTTLVFPNPQKINRAWAYESVTDIVAYDSATNEVVRLKCPRGAWQDSAGMTMRIKGKIKDVAKLRFVVESPRYPSREIKVSVLPEARLDMWEAKAGWGLRSFTMSTNATPVKTAGVRTLVFGHVNARRRNHPAPPNATGWECDKMDAAGFAANFNGYLGRMLKAGIKIDGTLVDSWECECQTWTPKMEEEFERRAGYKLRPWLPALFGYVLKSEAETERFLLDWRNVCSRLIEENYYGQIARLSHRHGMTVQYETAFGDVIPGDILRYWKFADEPMCEFWSPHENHGFVGSHDFKPVLPCVSAAHIYGKRRVSAEALTSFELTFNENFKDWKKIVDKHFARGVTHIVFHTYTHNPVPEGKPPSTSFGRNIGSPFLRRQTWWPYLKHFTKYLERCGRELERGVPAVDILMYLGDDVNHKPSERELLFGNRYKYDYLNRDVLMEGLEVKEGRLVAGVVKSAGRTTGIPVSYRVLWIPDGVFVLPETEARLAELERRGARVVRGDFVPDWPSPLTRIGHPAPHRITGWYQRRDGDEDIFFIVEGRDSYFLRIRNVDGATSPLRHRYDPVTGDVLDVSRIQAPGAASGKVVPVALEPVRDYEPWAVCRIYEGIIGAIGPCRAALDLGKVCDWATVYVNGKKAAELWCEPYRCDVTAHLKPGSENAVRVEVTSTWYNALVRDASLPEESRSTWTKCGPGKNSPYRDAGLLGKALLDIETDAR